ncbi:MAG: tyrosine-protein phosphatase [Bacteroidales bacterium]|nr:tyrosine-protein phosphatase [Bacteroidales bacterium]
MKKVISFLLSVCLLNSFTSVAQTVQDFTDRIVNPSFETGDLTGWTQSWIEGDIGVRPNSDAVYTVSNCNGSYMFNTWTQGDNYVFCCPNQFVEQELTGLPAGEYRLVAMVASNTYTSVNTPVWLYANEAQVSFVPQHKSSLEEIQLNFFVDATTHYVKLGMKSASWFKCDHFRLSYFGETEAYRQHLGEGQTGHFPQLVEYWNGFSSAHWDFVETTAHTHGVFPTTTNNMDVSQFEAAQLNYWTGPAYQLGDARITSSYTSLPAGWYEFRSQVRVYDENDDFDGTASGLSMLCGTQSVPITEGVEITGGSLVGKGFYDTYSAIAQVGTDGKLTIGFETKNASFNWLTWVDARLYYYGDIKPVDNRYLRQLDKLAGIVEQASGGHEGFAVVYQDAQNRLRVIDTDADAEVVFDEVRTAVLDVVKNYPAANGNYELTALITNADMTQGSRGWTAKNANLKTTAAGVGHAENTRLTATVEQVVKGLPAGHYTLMAQGFYRPTDVVTSVRNYENGIEEVKASLYLGDQSVKLPSQMEGCRYATTRTSGMQSTMEGRAFPTSSASAPTSFEYGDYWVGVDLTLDAASDVPLGIRIDPTTLTYNRTFFGNFRLFYGDDVPEVTLSDNDTEYTVSIPTKAHVTLQKKFTAGTLMPLCVPFDITTDDFAELYCVGGLKDKTAVIYPVSHVRAGVPCVVKPYETTDAIDFGIVTLSPVKPDIYLLPWNGGWLQSFYIKENRREVNYTWKYLLQAKGSSLTASTSLPFYVVEPQRMDFTATLENFSARKFLSEVSYFLSGDSYIDNYRSMTPPQRRDTPNPVMIPVGISDATNIYVEFSDDKSFATSTQRRVLPGADCYIPNLYPQRTYYFSVVADGTTRKKGCFHTEGRLRMIYAPTGNNIRDLGGWLTDDRTKRVTYGHIYRGSELNGDHTANAADLQVLRNLGIASEIDLRWDGESSSSAGHSPFGFSDTFYFANGNDWLPEDLNKEESIEHWRKEWALTLKTLRAGKALYFHCVWGADRTGLWAMLQEGILGLGFDAIFKDFELTSYSIAGARYKDKWSDRIAVIDALEGTTLTEKFENYFLNTLKIPQEEIDYFRSVMLEDVTAQPVVIDEDKDIDGFQAGKTDVTLKCTLQPGQRNAVILPFALNSNTIRALFGTGTLIENITGYDGTELQTKRVYTTTANVPFLLTPASVSDSHTYDVTGVTLERGAAYSTPFTGGRFSGNYAANFDVTQAVEAGHTSYVLNVPAFYVADTTTPSLKSLHAYIVLDTPDDASTRGIIFFNGETPTGIEDVQSTKNNVQSTIYDLSGRRVAQPTKGLYIIDGKKVLMR